MRQFYIILTCATLILAGIGGTSCRRDAKTDNQDAMESENIVGLDTAKPLVDTTAKPTVPEEPSDFREEEYNGGVIPAIEEASPDYARRLAAEGQDGFIVVDKARMKVILYDRYGFVDRSYDMACGKKYGAKHKKGDSRTPEGYFRVQGVYDSTDWLFTDDNGKTSKVKGNYGPRFIRIAPAIGIHGTRAPWSVGHRVSHGCIRISNDNIMELVDLVHTGMPVIVIPGKRDRAVNREEGHESVYFATSAAYKISDSEKKKDEEARKKQDEPEKLEPDSNVNATMPDTVMPVTTEPVETKPIESKQNESDSIPGNYF